MNQSRLNLLLAASSLSLIVAPLLPAESLVAHGDDWRYRKGTSEPEADWPTVADATLDASWLTGAGGFGYGDGDDTTVLDDMEGNYLTVYTRQTFEVTAAMDAMANLLLTIDYDDGYIAYLDGVEVSRAANVGGTPGTPYPYDLEPLPSNHEAGTPEVVNLGPLGDQLAIGTHILAVQGINGDTPSTDFSLIVDLDVIDPPAPVTWTLADSPVNLTSDFTMDGGVTLTIEAGVEVNLSRGVAIRAINGSHIDIAGSAALPVVIQAAGASDWDELSATGAGGSMTIRHAEISGGEVRFLTGVTGLAEDCDIHDSGASAMVFSRDATVVTMRRCRFANYGETNFKTTLTVLEDCLFEAADADAVDFDAAPSGSVIRRCTFRFGPAGTNTDAIDIGPSGGVPSSNVVIEDCLMHDFSDKGVSIGDGPTDAVDIIVRNCLIYNVSRGVQVKHASTTIVQDCTIADSEFGLHGFEKSGGSGGGIFNDCYNNILASNVTAIETEIDTVISIDYSDTQGASWPGTGNIDADPLFRDQVNGDYRLLTGSPCLGTGKTGDDMGVEFPVGGVPDVPGNLQVVSFNGLEAVLSWLDPDMAESEFVIEQSGDGTTWSPAATAPVNATGATVAGLGGSQTWSFRVRGTNFIGGSFDSEIATTSIIPGDRDSDGMPDSWEDLFGLDADDPSDAADDLDGDSACNLKEYIAGTAPDDPSSFLRIDQISEAGGVISLQFPALAGKNYSVLYSDALGTAPWLKLVDVAAEPTLRPAHVVTDSAGALLSRFYRLVTPASP